MAVDIIDSFILGTDLPLDSRYVVDSYYDVSLYWYAGMQVFQNNDQQLYWYDGSIWNPVEDTSLSGNFATISYVDGSLAVRDASISELYADKVDRAGDSMYGPLGFENNDASDYYSGTIYPGPYGALHIDSSLAIGLKAPYIFLPDASDNVGSFMTIGEDGLITYTTLNFPEKNWRDEITSTYTELIGLETSILAVTLDEDVSYGSIAWDLTLDLLSGQADVTARLYQNSTVVGTDYYSGNDGIVHFDGSHPIDGAGFGNGDVISVTVQSSKSPYDVIQGTYLDVKKLGNSVTAEWGSITGSISSQTDLQLALNLKADKLYVDGSLNVKADLSYVNSTFLKESSIGSGFSWNSGKLDVSVSSGVSQAYVDGSLAARDASITVLFQENDIQDASIENLRTRLNTTDSSLGTLTNLVDIHDVSIGAIEIELVRIDGSLNYIFPELSQLDASIQRLDSEQDSQDASINNLRGRIDIIDSSIIYLDSSMNQLFSEKSDLSYVNETFLRESSLGPQFYFQDGSLYVIDNTGVTYEYVDGSLAARDASITVLFQQNVDQDSSINANSSGITINASNIAQHDASIINLRGRLDITDVSVIFNTNSNIIQDISIAHLTNWNLSQDVSIENLRGRLDIVDGSITYLTDWNNTQDSSIIRIDNDIIINKTNIGDASIRISINETNINDVSARIYGNDLDIAQLDASIQRIDASLGDYVRKDGDTMTGDLTTTGLVVENDASFYGDVSVGGDLSLSQKIHFETEIISDPCMGDMWMDPSGHLMFAHELDHELDASSYNLVNRLLRTANDYSNFPDSSTFEGNDYILIEDALDGYKKKRITASAIATAITGGFGQNAAYAESLGENTTTAIAYQNKLTLDVSAAVNGKYRIGWALWVTNSNNSKSTRYRVELDGNSIDANTIKFPNGNSYLAFSGFEYPDVSSGNHTLTVDYSAVTNTAKIKQVRLEWYRASDSQQ